LSTHNVSLRKSGVFKQISEFLKINLRTMFISVMLTSKQKNKRKIQFNDYKWSKLITFLMLVLSDTPLLHQNLATICWSKLVWDEKSDNCSNNSRKQYEL